MAITLTKKFRTVRATDGKLVREGIVYENVDVDATAPVLSVVYELTKRDGGCPRAVDRSDTPNAYTGDLVREWGVDGETLTENIIEIHGATEAQLKSLKSLVADIMNPPNN